MFLLEINMGKVIGLVFKYNQINWPYLYPDTTFFIPQCSGISIQTQRKSVSGACVGAHDVKSAILDQSTNHHGNTYVKDNDYSQTFETPRKNN